MEQGLRSTSAAHVRDFAGYPMKKIEGLPAARGIVAVATEVVCRITFSPMLKPEVIPYRSSTRKTPNPSTADCMHRAAIVIVTPYGPMRGMRTLAACSSVLCINGASAVSLSKHDSLSCMRSTLVLESPLKMSWVPVSFPW